MMKQSEQIRELANQYGFYDLPVAVYITTPGGEILGANEKGREILQLPPKGEFTASLTDFYSDPAKHEEILREIKQKGDESTWLEKNIPLVVNGNNSHFRCYARAFLNESKEQVGCVLCMIDETEAAQLKASLEEFRTDVASVLHTYSATLVSMKFTIDSVTRSLAPDPFDQNKQLLPEQAAAALSHPANELANSLRTLLSLSEERLALPPEQLKEFSTLLDLVQGYEQLPFELRPAVLREAAFKVLSINDEVNKQKVPREVFRRVKHDAQELNRIASLINLHQVHDTILETDQQLRMLREFISTGLREEDKTACNVSSLISRALNNLIDFARNRGVQIRKKLDGPDVSVLVVERDIIRALGSLLHNAIKYSWSRPADKSAWVLIRTRVKDDQVLIEVENWGVPIPRDEIEKGLIFEVGYRGRLSSDRGRTGTGIGLADARHVARSHGGDVTVESFPAIHDKPVDDYAQPFLTTVTFTLPVYHGGKGAS